jgi:hypothetical protein
MGPGTGKNNASLGISVYQNPIVDYMAFSKAAPVAGKIVGAAAFRQGFLKNNFGDYFVHYIHVTAAFFRQLEVFLELIGKIKVEHWLGVFYHFSYSGLQFFLCGGRTLPFYLDFSGCDSLSFLHGGQSFGIGGMLRFPTMGANIPGISSGFDVFGLFYGVHKRLLILNYTLFWEERQLPVLWGLPGGGPP